MTSRAAYGRYEGAAATGRAKAGLVLGVVIGGLAALSWSWWIMAAFLDDRPTASAPTAAAPMTVVDGRR